MKRQVAVLGLVSLLCCAYAGEVRAQQSCDDGNECTGNGMCMPDGSCSDGAPLPDGTSCNHPSSSCLVNPTCLDGLCNGGTPMMDGTPCRFLDSECFTEGSCLTFSIPDVGQQTLCVGSLPVANACDDSDPCTIDVCNPLGGGCQHFPKCPTYECAVSSCNPSTGDCTTTPRNDGMQCAVGLECGGQFVCSAGVCIQGVPMPTQTPTMSSTTPTPTPTPPTQQCIGDCTDDGAVTITDIIILINAAKSGGAASACPDGDANGDGQITIDDILHALGNALNGC